MPGEERSGPTKINPHLERFLKAFEGSIDAADLYGKAADALIKTIVHEQNGLIAAVDQLIDEIRGLREDLRDVADAGGVRVAFQKLEEL